MFPTFASGIGTVALAPEQPEQSKFNAKVRVTEARNQGKCWDSRRAHRRIENSLKTALKLCVQKGSKQCGLGRLSWSRTVWVRSEKDPEAFGRTK